MSHKENPHYLKFTTQRARAKNRGIDWNLTFEQWLDIWVSSGKLPMRGKGIGKYVMGRHGDIGPYSVDNVAIVLYEDNTGDVNKNHPDTCGWTKRIGLDRGCYRHKNGSYTARFRQKHIGMFDTPEAASNAYKTAYSNYLIEQSKK